MGDSLVVYPCVTTFRHVIVVKFETMSNVAKGITTAVLEYYVQEHNEACVGGDGPPRLLHMEIKDTYGCP